MTTIDIITYNDRVEIRGLCHPKRREEDPAGLSFAPGAAVLPEVVPVQALLG